MDEKHKKILLHFITRTGMFITTVDESSIASFITGFEIGSNSNWEFTSLFRNHLEENLSIPLRSDGWQGQIRRLANKKRISWVTAFKQTALEALASEQNGGLDDEIKHIIIDKFNLLINRIDRIGYPVFWRDWVEEWNAVCLIKSKWFRSLWTENDFKVIKSMDREIKGNRVFEDWEPFRPTEQLLQLKDKFGASVKSGLEG